jgi:copper chaperone CopZ
MKTVNYKISGMNCNHCASAVSKVLSNCSGVFKVQISLENNKANLQIDETQFNIEDAISAVKNAGYELISTTN